MAGKPSLVASVANAAVRRERLGAVMGGVLAAFIFGGNFVSGRHAALAGMTPADVVALRFAVSALLFGPLLLRRGIADLGGIGWARGAALAALVGAPYIFLTMAGLRYAPAAHGALLSPALTIISGVPLSILMLHERPPRRAAIGIPLALIGLALATDAGFAAIGDTWRGDLMLATTGVAYGLFTVLVRRWRIPPVPAIAAVNLLSAAAWLPPYLVGGASGLLARAPLAELVGQAIFQGLFVGGVGIILYAHAATVLGAAQTALLPALVPVFGTLLAATLLGEQPSSLQSVGIALVVIGLLTAGGATRGNDPPVQKLRP
ncbi:MAG TPA: DMT family transporter [Stellaceae bacterium]|nr:DMT family transporter [Stellaceae bacterium]